MSPSLADYEIFHDACVVYAELRAAGRQFALGLTNLYYMQGTVEIFEPDGEVELLFDVNPERPLPIAELREIVSGDLCVYDMRLEARRCWLSAGHYQLGFDHAGFSFRVTREGHIDWMSEP